MISPEIDEIQATALLVDDEKSIRFTLSMLLQEEGFRALTAASGPEALDILDRCEIDVLVTDLRMKGMDGLQLMEKALAIDGDLQVVFISAYSDIDSAVKAIKRGAFDYLAKSFSNDEFILTVERAVERRRLIRENAMIRAELEENNSSSGCLFKDRKMRLIADAARRIARTSAAVLLTGESGTGKELLARYIHDNSPRRDNRFVVIDCSVIPEQLIESELFGHEKGAFTGAVSRRVGKFETAQGGTVFLDEIGELPASMQVKFLRVLQQKQFERVGGTDPVSIDVRVIAATNRDLVEDVREGLFREDLFYRLNICAIRIPALRDRRDDIPMLAERFVLQFASEHGKRLSCIDVNALLALLQHPFPGNVRELSNMIEQAVVIADDHDEVLSLRNLTGAGIMEPAEGMREYAETTLGCLSPHEDLDSDLTMKDYERLILENVYRRCRGNKNQVAQKLGLRRQTLYEKLKKHGIG